MPGPHAQCIPLIVKRRGHPHFQWTGPRTHGPMLCTSTTWSPTRVFLYTVRVCLRNSVWATSWGSASSGVSFNKIHLYWLQKWLQLSQVQPVLLPEPTLLTQARTHSLTMYICTRIPLFLFLSHVLYCSNTRYFITATDACVDAHPPLLSSSLSPSSFQPSPSLLGLGKWSWGPAEGWELLPHYTAHTYSTQACMQTCTPTRTSNEALLWIMTESICNVCAMNIKFNWVQQKLNSNSTTHRFIDFQPGDLQ